MYTCLELVLFLLNLTLPPLTGGEGGGLENKMLLWNKLILKLCQLQWLGTRLLVGVTGN